eukprot:m.454516 g.454516  ORF g.454516 m.454516 type:complete len:424 (+) comp20689_c0_seq1:119-1390(+)
MSGSSFGKIFKVTTFGESHCHGVGCIVDGVPPRLELSEEDIQVQLTRRRPGQSKLTTQRDEADKVIVMSGTEFGRTLGTPIGLMVRNKDQRPKDYGSVKSQPRPSHADYTYHLKYGIHASSGGGRSSARETIGRVAAGAIAEKWLKTRFGTEIVAFVSSVGAESLGDDEVDINTVTREEVDATVPLRCASKAAIDRMTKVLEEARDAEDSIGGTVTCVCRNVPVGLGEPCFDKLEALLAHAMLSIPATKGFEIGSGFEGTKLRGSAHNDPFVKKGDRLGTKSNRSGGIQGGISNGEHIYFRVAFKPPATIGKAQETATYEGDEDTMAAKGRHDPCVVPRAIAIVEGMAALVLADAAMIQLSREAASPDDNPAKYLSLPKMPPSAAVAAAAAAAAANGSAAVPESSPSKRAADTEATGKAKKAK